MNTITPNQLPEVLKVEDIQKFLQIGRRQAYDLIHSGQFHVVRLGRSYRVSKKVFIDWFNGTYLDPAI